MTSLLARHHSCRRCMISRTKRFISTSPLSCSSDTKKSEATKALLDKILRVDHAGELGANRIYQGQMAVLGKSSVGPVIEEMWDQEKEHLKKFHELLPEHRVRPTILMPLWDVAGFALGAGTALLGKEAAMACTVAVETVIGEHYDNQMRALMADGEDGQEKHKELLEIISKFRDEELHHHDIGLEHQAEQAPMYNTLTQVIKVGCYGAIWLSERM